MSGSATSRQALLVSGVMTAMAVIAAGCGSPQDAASGGAGTAAPLNVGVVYSQSGPLASYGQQYVEGFKAGLAYATDGTDKVGDRTITASYADDAGDPVKAVSAA